MNEDQQSHLRKFLLSIAQEINSEKLGLMKFGCGHLITGAEFDEIKKPFQLFELLIRKNKISKHDLTFLGDLLKDVRLDNLKERVQNYNCNAQADYQNHNMVARPRQYGLKNKKNPFIGRDSLVQSISILFTDQKKRLNVTLLGPPGFGKSSVVIHVGHNLYDNHGMSVIFVCMRQITTMHTLCSSILKTIDAECSLSDNVVVQAQNFLVAQKEPTILILDNCEDIQKSTSKSEFQKFIEYVGSYSKVQLLLGTRKQITTIQFECQTEKIPPLDDGDSAELLKEFAPGKMSDHEAIELAAQCNGVPLLIKLAGHRVNNGYKPAKLAESLKSNPHGVLKWRGNEIQDHLTNSIRVFLYSLDRDLQLALVKLANFANAFTQEDVCALYLKEPSDCYNMLCLLHGNALLQLEDSQYSLHPLLQAFCREERDQMACAEEGRKAIHIFNNHYLDRLEQIHRQFQSRNFQLSLKQFEHDKMNINQAMQNAINFGCKKTKRRCIDAFNNSVNLLGKIIGPSQCMKIYQDLYRIASDLNDTRRMAECMVSIGFRQLCDCNHHVLSQEVIDSLEHAYELFKLVSKRDRKTEAFAHCSSKLGLCYMFKGERQRGKSLMEAAVTLRRQLGDQVLLAASYCDKAVAARIGKEYSSAIMILKEQCYPEYKSNLGVDHPWVATVLNYISDSYKAQGRLDDAVEYTKQSLVIRHKTLGNHQDTARSYVLLASLLREQGHLEHALDNYKKALSIQEQVLRVHEETVASQQAIADLTKTLKLEEEHLAMRERSDTYTESLQRDTQYQTQISQEIRARADSHLEIEQRNCKLKTTALIVAFAAFVIYIIINYSGY